MKRIDGIVRDIPGARLLGDVDALVCGISHDSRDIQPGWIFAALRGASVDGAVFVRSAIEAGAAAVLCDAEMPLDIPCILVPDARKALGLAAASVYGYPSDELRLVGVTGTNGKTTITYLVEQALVAAGHPTGVMGTVEYRFGTHCVPAEHTTPEAPVIQRSLRDMRDRGATHVILEASSHGLALRRLDGCRFAVSAFTNLTQDHLDFHGSMAAYAKAKLHLFKGAVENNPDAAAVVNIDDPFGPEICNQWSGGRLLRVSCRPDSDADIRPSGPPRIDIRGVVADVVTPAGTFLLQSPLLGLHNLNNLLVSTGILAALDVNIARGATAWRNCNGAPGRLEIIPSTCPFSVLVDYAHTPDALVRILSALRPLTSGRLICVFGCGGDRDPAKRPLMGEAVARGADIAIVTSDNPRTEDPMAIIDMIVPGLADMGCVTLGSGDISVAAKGCLVVLDRARAIETAIQNASAGDTIIIAGKGHEDYQIIGKVKHHFDDREQARAVLAMCQKKDC